MSYRIRTRAEANLPAPPGTLDGRGRHSWTGITVHHTGGAFSTWRAVHDWQTQGRPPNQRLSYIGYSFGISPDGQITMLRGWDIHPAGDHHNRRLQVVFGGDFTNNMPTRAALDAFAWFATTEVPRVVGGLLTIVGHRDVWPRGHANYSACPGDRFYSELRNVVRGMSTREEAVSKPEDTWSHLIDTPEFVRRTWPNDFQPNNRAQAMTYLRSGYGHARRAAESSERTEEIALAILAAATAEDYNEIIARIDAHHEKVMARFTQAEDERNELRALVAAVASGDLTAEAVVHEIGRRLSNDT